MPSQHTCLHCGAEFPGRRREANKFCGAACYHAYEAEHGGHGVVERVEFKCGVCGKPFFRAPGELRSYRKAWGKDPLYCSRICGGVGRRKDGHPCVVCGKPVHVEWKPSNDGSRTPRTVGRRNLYCSVECKGVAKSAMYHARKPDREIARSVTRQGYIRLRIPLQGQKCKEVLEHRLVMEQMLGRPLRPEETVHHRNGQRADNRPDNLDLRSGNHGPGGDVSAMIRWAHEFIALYPQFDREGVLHPVVVAAPDHS